MTTRKELLAYGIFGLLTTLLNYIVYVVCLLVFEWTYIVSNTCAWVLAVFFAYVTNKLYVFSSHTRSAHDVLRELWQFFAARVLSLGLETGVLWVGITLLAANELLVKIFANILVVVFNYAASKWLIFTTHDRTTNDRSDGQADGQAKGRS